METIEQDYKENLLFFKEVNGKFGLEVVYHARKISIPGTNQLVLLVKEKEKAGFEFLPIPTKRSGKNDYYYFIKENDDIVNFKFGFSFWNRLKNYIIKLVKGIK